MTYPDVSTISFFDTIIAATKDRDYARFVSVGDECFRKEVTEEMFQAVSSRVAPRLRQGFTATYLGHLRQERAHVSLWKLSFLDGGDDRLVRLSVSECKVNGVLITPAFC